MKKSQNDVTEKKLEPKPKNQNYNSKTLLIKLNSVAIFLLKKIMNNAKNVTNELITNTGFQQLDKYKIYKGSLLQVMSTHGMTTKEKTGNNSIRSFFYKDEFVVPMDFATTKSTDSDFVPNINMWFVVLYNNNIYHVDAFEFISFIEKKYIVHATT